MAVRQYIGARYVTKIYENSLDPSSAEWEASVNYEPLTLVTFNNGSYLSKKTVPASAGNPSTEPNYWVQTGFYNGQIVSLQNQIDDINNNTIPDINSDIQTLTDHVDDIVESISPRPSRMVCITDSYGTHSTTNWCTILAGLFNLGDNNFYYWAEGSSGFEHAGLSGHTFQSLLALHISDIDSPETISDVFIGGGTNDFYYLSDENTLKSAMENTADYIQEQFPNARIHYIFMGYFSFMSSNMRDNYITTINLYESMRYLKNVNVINAYAIMHVPAYREDSQHPNITGSTEIARAIYCNIYNNDYDVNVRGSNVSIIAAQDVSIATNNLRFDVFKDTLFLFIDALNISGNFNVSSNEFILLGTIDGVSGQSFHSDVRVNTVITFDSIAKKHVTVSLFLQGDGSKTEVYVNTRTLNESFTADAIKFAPLSISIPLVYC